MTFGIFQNSGRKTGKHYATLLQVSKSLPNGSCAFPGIDEAQAVKIQQQLKEMGCDAIFEPMYKTTRPKAIHNLDSIEGEIVGMEYGEKKLTGYIFKTQGQCNK